MNGQNPILLDGSAGTALWDAAAAKGIERMPVWRYNIEHPELVAALHQSYLAAGSKMIQTNTFDANRLSVARDSDYSVREVISAAVKIAREAADAAGAKAYFSAGPLGQLLEPYGPITKAKCKEVYREMLHAGAEYGAEMIVLETFLDVEMAKIAAEAGTETGLPVICSMTFDKRGRTFMGNTVKQIVKVMEPVGIAGLGMNCSFGPVESLPVIREFSETTSLPLYFKPNAGVGESCSAESFAEEASAAFPLVQWIGGCCGCDDGYIRALAARLG